MGTVTRTRPHTDVLDDRPGRPPRSPFTRTAGTGALCGIVIAVVVASIALTQGAHNPPPTNAGIRAVVAFVGDSNISFGGQATVADLTYGTNDATYPGNQLDNNYVPVFVTRGGSGIRAPACVPASCDTDNFWQLKLDTTFDKVTPDAIVTDLGINDAATPGTATTQGYADYADKIDWLMRAFPDKPIFWTNLPCGIEPATYESGCQTINRSLSDASNRWSNLHILGWAQLANTHPRWMRYEGTGYGVHYTSTGYAAWTQLVLHALDTSFPN
jgi:hypothetical protein